MKSKAWTEKVMQGVFFIAACTSVLAVALICIFLFANGIPAMSKIGFGEFLTGELWKPKNDIYGIFPMIIGSLYVTAGAIIIGVPIGILTAVFMAFYCPKVIYKPLKMATELLAGIPSVVYGFFGLVVLVPGHVEDDGLYGLWKSVQREAGVFGMFRLHADHVAQFKSGVCHVSHFSSCNRMSHSRISLPSAHAGHPTWHTYSCCPP